MLLLALCVLLLAGCSKPVEAAAPQEPVRVEPLVVVVGTPPELQPDEVLEQRGIRGPRDRALAPRSAEGVLLVEPEGQPPALRVAIGRGLVTTQLPDLPWNALRLHCRTGPGSVVLEARRGERVIASSRPLRVKGPKRSTTVSLGLPASGPRPDRVIVKVVGDVGSVDVLGLDLVREDPLVRLPRPGVPDWIRAGGEERRGMVLSSSAPLRCTFDALEGIERASQGGAAAENHPPALLASGADPVRDAGARQPHQGILPHEIEAQDVHGADVPDDLHDHAIGARSTRRESQGDRGRALGPLDPQRARARDHTLPPARLEDDRARARATVQPERVPREIGQLSGDEASADGHAERRRLALGLHQEDALRAARSESTVARPTDPALFEDLVGLQLRGRAHHHHQGLDPDGFLGSGRLDRLRAASEQQDAEGEQEHGAGGSVAPAL